MSGIEKRTGTYDENLTDIGNLKPLTFALTAILAVWSLVYLLGPTTPSSNAQTGFSLVSSAQSCRSMVPDPGPHILLRSPAQDSAKPKWAVDGFVTPR
jgi:hypothetical protein